MLPLISAFINRNQLSMLASILLLSAAMVIWVDLFIFSKVIFLPDWADALPRPVDAPSFLAFLCLLPAALIASTIRYAVRGVVVSVVVAPLFAVATFALDPIHQNSFIVANVLFHYVWIILFHCAIPSMLLLSLRVTAHYFYRKVRG